MASDDQEVEAWYLQGWCFFLMAESAKETNTKIEDLSWEELAQDSLECLEQCKTVSFIPLFYYLGSYLLLSHPVATRFAKSSGPCCARAHQ